MSTWPSGQQVLVAPFQQIPAGLAAAATTSQRPVTQQMALPDNLAPQQVALSDSWRQSIVLDGFDQTPLAAQLVGIVVIGRVILLLFR